MKKLEKIIKELDLDTSRYSDGKYFIDREISWLNFNERILELAKRKGNPLIERLKFLSITSTNLDEFIMVRMSESKSKMLERPDEKEISGMTYTEEYNTILKIIMDFKPRQLKLYESLKKGLSKSGYSIVKINSLSKREKSNLDKEFDHSIFPILTPVSIDGTNPFPPIYSKEHMSYIITEDSRNKKENLSLLSLTDLPRLIEVKHTEKGKRKFVLVEDLVERNISKLFVNKNISFFGTFRILRDADIPVNDNSDIYFVDRMREILEKRQVSSPIFMELDKRFSGQNISVIANLFSLKRKNIFISDSIIDLSFLMKLPFSDSLLEFDKFEPVYPPVLLGEKNMFSAVENKDVILHHPYQSFSPVIKFIEHAADDPSVLSIKQTLYRVSSIDGPVVRALCDASIKGKDVTVLLELKARFDEEQNISMINKMRSAGITIIYGIEKLKTHCKFSVIVRKKKDGIRLYSHIGTGNYNDKTARLYTDISLFTFNQNIGRDLLHTFNMISGASEPSGILENIIVSPHNLRSSIYSMIDKEISCGKKGKIIMKLNSLSDYGIISRLYKASESGVKIDIICRGICSMRPINKNIRIKSIVGRYLEHSRIYYFKNNKDSKVFISSADLLGRNLDRRVEILVPILENHAEDFLLDILAYSLNDTDNSFIMNKDGSYEELPRSFDIFEEFILLVEESASRI